jgi:hypothetical protein
VNDYERREAYHTYSQAAWDQLDGINLMVITRRLTLTRRRQAR